MAKHVVATTEEIRAGERKIIEIEGISIGIFNVQGTYYALRNRCPPQGASLCLGSLEGMALPSQPGEYVWEREGEILRCPWHGWEFDVTTGRSVCSPQQVRVRAYEVTVDPIGDRNTETAVETFPVSVHAGNVVLHLPT